LNGERRDIFKDPKTDSGIKKSAKGLLRVEQEGNNLVLFDQQTEEQENQGLLEVVFLDGKITKVVSLAEIRTCLNLAL
jgi:nicotinamide phosphoribosyltransferase